jgi:transposase
MITIPNFDLTDEQWSLVAPLIPPPHSTGGRPPLPPRTVLDGILWKIRNSLAWYHLPARYPSWQTCHRYNRIWENQGVFQPVIAALYRDLRDRGGLDFCSALLDRRGFYLSYMDESYVLFVHPDYYDTWQLSTALVFARLIAKRLTPRYPLIVI